MLKTSTFKLSRTQLAYMGSEEYLRSLWWFAATVPLFGILMLVFGEGPMKAIGLFAIAWPFSIPARGIVSSSKASKLFTAGCFAELTDNTLTYYEDTDRAKPLRYQIPLNQVKDVIERRDFYLIRMRRLGFAPLPLSAFSTDNDRAAFVRTIALAIEQRELGNC